MRTIAILASGSGTNAEVIIRYFEASSSIKVACVITNRKDAGVRTRAEQLGIPHYYFDNQQMREASAPLKLLSGLDVDLIVLAGYMNLISESWLNAYPERILNIHPALLPSYGGRGMYGRYVHEAVLANGERISGITIHLVNARYDEGRHLLQATCPIYINDTPESLAKRIHGLEHAYYPFVIERYLLSELSEG